MKRQFLFPLLILFSITLNAQNTPQVSFKQGDGIRLLAADSSAFTRLRVWMQPQIAISKVLTDNTEWTSDASIRRARFNFTGWLKSPKLAYHFQVMLATPELRTGLDATAQQEGYTGKMLLDAALKWKFHPNFELWFGQENIDASYEGHTPGFAMQLVNKSLFNGTFNYNRETGLQLYGNFGNKIVLRPHLRLTLGDGRNILTGNHGGFQYIARMEVMPFGKFTGSPASFGADFEREPTPKLAVAATLDFNHNAARQRGNAGRFMTDDEGNFLHTNVRTFLVDAVFKYQGISALGAFAVRTVSDTELPFHEATGFHLQAGYLLENNYEVTMRYGLVAPIGNKVFAGSREYIVGISKYINGHTLKVQSDIGLITYPSVIRAIFQYRFQIVAGF